MSLLEKMATFEVVISSACVLASESCSEIWFVEVHFFFSSSSNLPLQTIILIFGM